MRDLGIGKSASLMKWQLGAYTVDESFTSYSATDQKDLIADLAQAQKAYDQGAFTAYNDYQLAEAETWIDALAASIDLENSLNNQFSTLTADLRETELNEQATQVSNLVIVATSTLTTGTDYLNARDQQATTQANAFSNVRSDYLALYADTNTENDSRSNNPRSRLRLSAGACSSGRRPGTPCRGKVSACPDCSNSCCRS